METDNTKEIEKKIQEYELQRLRKANTNFKLEIIDLRQKLKEIYSVLTDNTDNLIQLTKIINNGKNERRIYANEDARTRTITAEY